MDVSTALNHSGDATTSSFQHVGEATSPTPQGAKGTSSSASTRGVLDGPSLVVTERTAEAFQAMAQSTYETKMNTIKNLVDTPEERKAKAEREIREQAQADDAKARQADLDEKASREERILDEIASNRVISDK